MSFSEYRNNKTITTRLRVRCSCFGGRCLCMKRCVPLLAYFLHISSTRFLSPRTSSATFRFRFLPVLPSPPFAPLWASQNYRSRRKLSNDFRMTRSGGLHVELWPFLIQTCFSLVCCPSFKSSYRRLPSIGVGGVSRSEKNISGCDLIQGGIVKI